MAPYIGFMIYILLFLLHGGYPNVLTVPEITIQRVEADVRVPYELTCTLPGDRDPMVSYTIRWFISDEEVMTANLDDSEAPGVYHVLPVDMLQGQRLYSVNILTHISRGYQNK